MAVNSTSQIVEGVFAIHKPPHLSSAQVLRDLQSHFTPSKLFAPLLERERRKRADLDRLGQQRRRPNLNEGQVKLGHGGTLDPLATGILIVGVGKGTRQLPSFLGCKKTYKTVVLFGRSTDTYDVAGKIVASASYEHVTKELVEEKLSSFTGKIKQAPPIYSAIKMNGMKAYDYARSGKELPRELAPRDMEVIECKMLEWHEGGTHEYRWPAQEAPEDEKEAARKLIQNTNTLDEAVQGDSRKRKSSQLNQGMTEPEAKKPKTNDDLPEQFSAPNNPAPRDSPKGIPSNSTPAINAAQHIHAPPPPSTTRSPAPACTISLTVSSGFYVRSFAHDLGLACNSLGIMASLIRSRQGDFSLNPSADSADSASYSVLDYADLALGEDNWGPKVAAMLERWTAAHPPESDDNDDKKSTPRVDDRDHHTRNQDRDRGEGRWQQDIVRGSSTKRRFKSGQGGRDSLHWNDRGQSRQGSEGRRERRNTSSSEE